MTSTILELFARDHSKPLVKTLSRISRSGEKIANHQAASSCIRMKLKLVYKISSRHSIYCQVYGRIFKSSLEIILFGDWGGGKRLTCPKWKKCRSKTKVQKNSSWPTLPSGGRLSEDTKAADNSLYWSSMSQQCSDEQWSFFIISKKWGIVLVTMECTTSYPLAYDRLITLTLFTAVVSSESRTGPRYVFHRGLPAIYTHNRRLLKSLTWQSQPPKPWHQRCSQRTRLISKLPGYY